MQQAQFASPSSLALFFFSCLAEDYFFDILVVSSIDYLPYSTSSSPSFATEIYSLVRLLPESTDSSIVLLRNILFSKSEYSLQYLYFGSSQLKPNVVLFRVDDIFAAFSYFESITWNSNSRSPSFGFFFSDLYNSIDLLKSVCFVLATSNAVCLNRITICSKSFL